MQASGADRARRKPPSSLDAYDQCCAATRLPWDEPASAAEAKRAFERAIEIDPEYGLPYSLLAALFGREGPMTSRDRTRSSIVHSHWRSVAPSWRR